MITCDEDLAGQIYGGREELEVRSIGHCAVLEEDAMHIGTEADVSAHVLDISGKKTDLGAGGLRQRRFDRLENTAVSCKQRDAAGTRQDTNNSPNFGGTQPVDEFSCGREPR